MAKRCAGTTKAGKPCRGYAIEGSEFCVTHDPEKAAERAAWRAAGGRATKTPEGEPVELLNVEDVRKGLAAVIGSLWKLDNTNERARALVSAYTAALRTFEVGELEERLEAIEARLEAIDGSD